jgi:leucyl aminopeptidase
VVALQVRLAAAGTALPGMLALPVAAPAGDGDGPGRLSTGAVRLPAELGELAEAFLADVDHGGGAGTVKVLPRPGQRPRRLLILGIGDVDEPDEADWRDAGAGLVRAADKEAGTTGVTSVTVALPDGVAPELVGAFAEGAWLAAYRYSLASEPDTKDHVRRITLAVAPERIAGYEEAVERARIVAEATATARDWTNTPASEKSPAWLADAIRREAGRAGHTGRATGLEVRVWEPERLRAEGFGGVLAVGGSSPRQPRLVELRYRPRRAAGSGDAAYPHVVLVGKGITFDTGGIDIKTNAGLQLMRKDMGGAAAVAAATIGAARLGLPVRVTALLPLADNAIDGDSFRPGDVIRHYGGQTSEVLNTDAEGRLVLADAIAYAVRRLAPDTVVDLATLTGAQNVALGKRIAALFSEDDALAVALSAAGDAVGERTWRMPLPDDYLDLMRSPVADITNIELPREAGSVTAALFLREFTGTARRRWAHVDMSAPAWSSGADGVLAKGATGWGVRLLLRFLSGQG